MAGTPGTFRRIRADDQQSDGAAGRGRGLEPAAHGCAVELYTDSKYIHDAVNKGWLANWKRNGWRTADKKPVKNQDLWLQIDALLQAHDVHFNWVRGHSGNPENECCDRAGQCAALGQNLPKDTGLWSR
jgi:ribonuclease HI